MNSSLYRTLSEQLKQIAFNYFVAKRSLRGHVLGFSSGSDEEMNSYRDYIDRVKRAYETLSDMDKEIVNNDFFYEDYPHWWEEKYSRVAYYRHKRGAMQNFLRAFNE